MIRCGVLYAVFASAQELFRGTAAIGGPEVFTLAELVRKGLAARNDPREVVIDPEAQFFGATLSRMSLLPGDAVRVSGTQYES